MEILDFNVGEIVLLYRWTWNLKCNSIGCVLNTFVDISWFFKFFGWNIMLERTSGA